MRTVLEYMTYPISAFRSSESLDFLAYSNHTCVSLAKFIKITRPGTQSNCPLVCKNIGLLQISVGDIMQNYSLKQNI